MNNFTLLSGIVAIPEVTSSDLNFGLVQYGFGNKEEKLIEQKG